ncbi:hypothetical protein [Pseudomonas sp. CC120222-01a]|uniref:hypothetical protein n=1 Tax=Pseudomonas sp. CC120222-01a TaxID=1378075 RepID=UPI000D84F362|nr:hypothetical protein [Pseudomonas sp. CC120222-01a]PVZ41318.1 hypothetical protein N430_02381 [Pseudomonas sp. CC120222-01a]
MKYHILDFKDEGQSKCFLVKATLKEYLSSLPKDYDEYSIQRSIVSNIYLDRLIHTVLNKGHIPSITLITTDNDIGISTHTGSEFKILDGLQRTYRLKIISDTKDLFLSKVAGQIEGLTDFQIKRKFKDELANIGSAGNVLISVKEYFDKNGRENLEKCFTENFQWFEVWIGLTPEQEVRKMLLLNAGHKPVNIKHQLELLFLNLLPIMAETKSNKIRIKREKDVSATSFSKVRKVGDYQFSQLIAALVSYVSRTPVITNTMFIESIQNDQGKLELFVDMFSYQFLEDFIGALYLLDVAASDAFGDEGVQWMGREVSLAAMFAAIGSSANPSGELVNIAEQLAKNFHLVNLGDYEKARNSVDLAKVNVGNINRISIFQGIESLISSDYSSKIDWALAFAREPQ